MSGPSTPDLLQGMLEGLDERFGELLIGVDGAMGSRSAAGAQGDQEFRGSLWGLSGGAPVSNTPRTPGGPQREIEIHDRRGALVQLASMVLTNSGSGVSNSMASL